MNSRQLQYAIALFETRNFSQVAEKLNISQPALSKQILSLENELGVKLFDRSTSPVTVTPAGWHFIREAKELIYKEDQLLRSMGRFQSGEAGQLVIGVTPFRSSYLIPQIVKTFRTVYPNVQVTLREAGSDILRKEAADGKYDFAVVNLPVDDVMLETVPLESDRMVLVLPRELEHLVQLPPEGEQIDFAACKDLPFAVVHKNQEMRRLFEKLCTANDFYPNIAAEVVGLTTAWEMARVGVAATILPMQFVAYHGADERGLTVRELRAVVYSRQPAIITRKGQYISPFARYAMDLLINQCQ